MDATKHITINLIQGETLLKEGPANLQRGIESVGGRLFVTNKRVHFRGHSLNVQAGAVNIPLAQIASVEVGKTKVFGVPFAANAVVIQTAEGRAYRVTVQRRDEWKAAIDGARG